MAYHGSFLFFILYTIIKRGGGKAGEALLPPPLASPQACYAPAAPQKSSAAESLLLRSLPRVRVGPGSASAGRR